MRVDAFQYDLPAELIAQNPEANREHARLLVLPRGDGAPQHCRISDLPDLLPRNALVVLNDTRVVPARLIGRRADTAGRVDVLLVERAAGHPFCADPKASPPVQRWRALAKARGFLKIGTRVEVFEGGADAKVPPLVLQVVERASEGGLLEVALWSPSGEPIEQALHRCGSMPLPPYIKRDPDSRDVERYQTVYARRDGAVAAPTAGLHFTNDLLERLRTRGCDVASVTLHVGLGTFRPVTVEDLDLHPMHTEHFVVPQATADAIAEARTRGGPVVAVGTTTVRALEAAASADRAGHVVATTAETRLLIQPGHRWRIVDGLLTNFHVPRSTLLALVCALAGRERVLDAYRLAVEERYRFFSYGDAMLVWRRP